MLGGLPIFLTVIQEVIQCGSNSSFVDERNKLKQTKIEEQEEEEEGGGEGGRGGGGGGEEEGEGEEEDDIHT